MIRQLTFFQFEFIYSVVIVFKVNVLLIEINSAAVLYAKISFKDGHKQTKLCVPSEIGTCDAGRVRIHSV